MTQPNNIPIPCVKIEVVEDKEEPRTYVGRSGLNGLYFVSIFNVNCSRYFATASKGGWKSQTKEINITQGSMLYALNFELERNTSNTQSLKSEKLVLNKIIHGSNL